MGWAHWIGILGHNTFKVISAYIFHLHADKKNTTANQVVISSVLLLFRLSVLTSQIMTINRNAQIGSRYERGRVN